MIALTKAVASPIVLGPNPIFVERPGAQMNVRLVNPIAVATALRIGAICAGVVLYGLLSAPAPRTIRWIEIAVGALLTFGIGFRGPTRLLIGRGDDEATGGFTAVLAFSWLLWVPLLRGVQLGNEPDVMIRDVVPLAFLFSPLVLVPFLARGDRRTIEFLAWAATLAGLLFALRWSRRVDWSAIGSGLPEGPNHLLNAPLVLFASAFAIARAVDLLSRGKCRPAALGAMAGGLICLVAPLAAVHRAALIVVPPALLVGCLKPLRRSRRALVAIVIAAIVAGVLIGPDVLEMAGNAIEKSRQVGLNSRVEEAVAAIERAAASPASLLLGEGWGALLVDPAVGDWRVAYTHTALSYFLFKSGLLGVAAFSLWLGTLVRPAFRALPRDPAIVAAAAGPILAALVFQSAYKYLDTGLLLSLVLTIGARNPLPESRARA